MSDQPAAALDPVRLRVVKIDLADLRAPGTVVLDIEDNFVEAVEQAKAWAQVRGYDRLGSALDWFFDFEAPAAGYSALINKPHSLKILVTWPWAPTNLPTGL